MRLSWAAAGMVAAAAVGGIATQACASHAHGYHYAPDIYRVAFDRGFEDGAEHGANDARHRQGFDYAHDKKYRCGDAGYERHYGSRGRVRGRLPARLRAGLSPRLRQPEPLLDLAAQHAPERGPVDVAARQDDPDAPAG